MTTPTESPAMHAARLRAMALEIQARARRNKREETQG